MAVNEWLHSLFTVQHMDIRNIISRCIIIAIPGLVSIEENRNVFSREHLSDLYNPYLQLMYSPPQVSVPYDTSFERCKMGISFKRYLRQNA